MTYVKRQMNVGCPWSGTALLQAILSAHDEVFSCPKTRFHYHSKFLL